MDDRQKLFPRSFLSAAAGLGALAVCAAFAPSPARAADDGQGTVVGSFMQLLGLNDSSTDSPRIDYRPRAPLVLPKTMTLPPPQKSPVASNPAWPKDPDALAAKRAAELARAPASSFGGHSEMPFDKMKQDRVAESRSAPDYGCDEWHQHQCDPHKIWAQLRIKKGDPGAIQDGPKFAPGKEPPRKYLTEPPRGYMEPTQVVKRTWSPPVAQDAEDNPNVYYMHQAGHYVNEDSQN